MTHLRVALLPGLVVVAALVFPRAAAAECAKPRGKPIYRVTREPLHKPAKGEPAAVQTQTFSVFSTGRWVWVGAGELDSGEAMANTGCIGPMAMKEIERAIVKARFRVTSGDIMTCQAVPTTRVKYAALRRGKRITTEEPCGIPLDPTTTALVHCAEMASRSGPRPIDELRKICRGQE